ncbi:MAG: KH domain-containing protein [Candidatus Peribacteraceae bacterium]|nr:KH domain-containing protein [Candidatus Peribacteraceae bacterium]MDD5074922.1 KH domain-containing protein [Candidatus Peribacteraceae bacterium]
MSETASAELPGFAFLKYVLESICEDKDELSVNAQKDELGILLTIQVSERDMGKLIGKGGQTVKALRTLLRIIGGNASERVNLKVLEPATSSTAA